MSLDKRRVVSGMAAEIAAKATTMDVSFQPVSALQLAGLVQLATRHPDISESLRETAERFLSGVREYFADCPEVLAVIRLGDDPANDVEP